MATISDDRKPGWCWIDNDVIDKYGPVIGPHAIAVYLVLARYANKDTRKAWPSFATIAKLAGVSRPTAIKAIGKLLDAGLIATEKRSSGYGDWDSNSYTLLAVNAQGALLGSQPDLPPSQPDLPRVVKEVYQGGKGGLLEQDSINKTYSEQDSKDITTPSPIGSGVAQPPEPPSPPAPDPKPKTPKPDTTPLLFDPVQDAVLVELLAAHYASLDRNPPRKFQNAVQRDGYRTAAQFLGPDKTRQAITQCIVGNRYALGQIVTSLLRWVDNEKRGGVNRNGQQPNEPRGFANLRNVIRELKGV